MIRFPGHQRTCAAVLYAASQLTQDGSDSTGNDVNVVETDKTFEAEVKLPGDSKEDLSAAVDKCRMTTRAEVGRAMAQNEADTFGPRPSCAEANLTGSRPKHGVAGLWMLPGAKSVCVLFLVQAIIPLLLVSISH